MTSNPNTRSFIPLRIAIVTVSDTRSLDDDKSGRTLVDRLEGAGHKLADRAIVRDDVETIGRPFRRGSNVKTLTW